MNRIRTNKFTATKQEVRHTIDVAYGTPTDAAVYLTEHATEIVKSGVIEFGPEADTYITTDPDGYYIIHIGGDNDMRYRERGVLQYGTEGITGHSMYGYTTRHIGVTLHSDPTESGPIYDKLAFKATKKSVYHGSPSDFKVFDTARMGQNGTSEGKGHYFTTNISVAESYAQKGYLYTVDLQGKELSGKRLTITPEEYLHIVEYLDGYLDNMTDVAYYGLEHARQEAVKHEYNNATDDADLISGMCNMHGSAQDVLQAFYDLLGYGYIAQQATWQEQVLYIALTNDAIQIQSVKEVN